MSEGTAPIELAQLVTEHHETLYRYAYRLAGTSPDAEDLVQQVFLIAQQKLAQVRNADTVRGWLFTVLRNCYLKSHRKRIPMPLAGTDFDINDIPARDLEATFDSEQLQEAIDRLSDDFKIIVLMFYFEHRPYREIAEQLSIPIGTVMSRLARAKAQMRSWLRKVQTQDETTDRVTTDRVEDKFASIQRVAAGQS